MILSLPNVALELGVSRRTVERLTDSGALPKVQLSPGRVGVPSEAVQAYVEGGGWLSAKTATLGLSSSNKGERAYSAAVRRASPKPKRKHSRSGSVATCSTAQDLANVTTSASKER